MDPYEKKVICIFIIIAIISTVGIFTFTSKKIISRDTTTDNYQPPIFHTGDIVKINSQVGIIIDSPIRKQNGWKYEILFQDTKIWVKESKLKLFSPFPWEMINSLDQIEDIHKIPNLLEPDT